MIVQRIKKILLKGIRMICVLILACNRPRELNESLRTWSTVSYPISVSLDCVHQETHQLAKEWKKSMPNLEVKPSFQFFHKEVGEQAKKTDERVTRHWLSAITKLFVKKQCTYVIFAEEDHIIAPNFQLSVENIIPAFISCPTCWSINMGCHKDCWGMRSSSPFDVCRMESGNMGVIYSKKIFLEFLDHIDIYCDMLGDWDINLGSMATLGYIRPHSLTYLLPRIHHLTTCRSSRTGITHRSNCNWANEISQFHAEAKVSNQNLTDLGIAKYNRRTGQYSKADAETKRRCIEAARIFR